MATNSLCHLSCIADLQLTNQTLQWCDKPATLADKVIRTSRGWRAIASGHRIIVSYGSPWLGFELG